jgi:branched-chain amino acid transport system substrate-binding protein
VKLGVLHPVTGALSYSDSRAGLRNHCNRRNKYRRRHQRSGKIDTVLGDAQSTPEGGTAEVEK